MIPVITLVGRPNVGKSTLFNRLTRTYDALVADFPGLTRDRKYGRAKWQGYEFIIVDTGGIDNTKGEIETYVSNQSIIAIKEADIVLFMVDGSVGLMEVDRNIARHLRSFQKTTVIVANKTDGINTSSAIGDFYSLGMGEVIPVAALHGRGIKNLLEQVLLLLISDNSIKIDEDKFAPWVNEEIKETKVLAWGEKKPFDLQKKVPIKLAIVGRPNVGKSMLTNRILREKRVVVYDMPGTTRDSVYIPMVYDEQEYVLIDTAGVRKRGKITDVVEEFSVIKTLKAIEDANVVLLVIDAYEGVFDQDLSLIDFILNSGRSLVIVVNKWDKLSSDMRNEVKKSLDYRFSFINFAHVHFISALYNRGINNLFKFVNEAYRCATKRVSTSLLTYIMRIAVDEYQPPLVRGRRIKLKYAHSGGYNPPIIVIHGTQVKSLPDAYKRYLINYFYRSLKIVGTPIRIQFNESANPFARRRNILTPTQRRKRKRLISYIKKK